MGIKDLEFTTVNLASIIDLRRQSLRKGTVHPKHVLDLSRCYRYLGCGKLLSGYDAVSFFYCLHLAADAYLQFLERKQQWPDLDPYYMARSRAEPLLDALALGDTELVRRIDALTVATWQDGMEYEEDFWFLTLLPRLLLPTTRPEELHDGLDAMERALEGIEFPRYDALVALVKGDSEGFEKALLALIDAWRADAERERRGGLGNQFALSTEAHVFVEGIALVRVARARGLDTRSQYPLIPPLALSEPQPGIKREPLWS